MLTNVSYVSNQWKISSSQINAYIFRLNITSNVRRIMYNLYNVEIDLTKEMIC